MVRQLIGSMGAVAAALPAAALGVWSLGALIQTPFGANPHWPAQTLNMTEAAAMRDMATVVARLDRGEDPHRRRELPADLVFNERAALTPFEAAIALGRTEMAELMIWHGYHFDAVEWRQLRCLATLEQDDEMGSLLDRHRPFPSAAPLDCAGVERPWTR